MCWYSKKKKAARIAVEDILVYKVMYRKPNNGRFRSLYRRMDYEPEKIYWTDVNPISIDSPLYPEMMIYKGFSPLYLEMKIDKGFHSYSMDKTMATKDKYQIVIYNMENNEIVDSIFFSDNLVIAKCIIPKGSKYYKNDLGEIVSDQIIITGEAIAFD